MVNNKDYLRDMTDLLYYDAQLYQKKKNRGSQSFVNSSKNILVSTSHSWCRNPLIVFLCQLSSPAALWLRKCKIWTLQSHLCHRLNLMKCTQILLFMGKSTGFNTSQFVPPRAEKIPFQQLSKAGREEDDDYHFIIYFFLFIYFYHHYYWVLEATQKRMQLVLVELELWIKES